MASNAFEIQILNIRRGGLQNHLQLMVFVQAIGILAVAPVGRPAAGLHVGDAIGLRTQHAQEGLRVHGARAHLHVIRLLQDAIAPGPKSLQLQDQLLKCGALAFVQVLL